MAFTRSRVQSPPAPPTFAPLLARQGHMDVFNRAVAPAGTARRGHSRPRMFSRRELHQLSLRSWRDRDTWMFSIGQWRARYPQAVAFDYRIWCRGATLINFRSALGATGTHG